MHACVHACAHVCTCLCMFVRVFLQVLVCACVCVGRHVCLSPELTVWLVYLPAAVCDGHWEHSLIYRNSWFLRMLLVIYRIKYKLTTVPLDALSISHLLLLSSISLSPSLPSPLPYYLPPSPCPPPCSYDSFMFLHIRCCGKLLDCRFSELITSALVCSKFDYCFMYRLYLV